jgi:hypothetical protein
MPIDGFVLSVDGKLRTRYQTSKKAMTAASKFKQSYPVIQGAIHDAINGSICRWSCQRRRRNGPKRVARENDFI